MSDKKKIFYICPHLSTGGQPQYTLKQVETFEKEADITVFEVQNYSNDYTVQRKQFKNLVQLHGNQAKLLDYIKKQKPDVLSFQEVPESMFDKDILKQLYRNERPYYITVTTHSRLTGRKDFTYLPDRIIAVSPWQLAKFQKEFPDTQVDIWEYPIENKKPTKSQKELARVKLGIHMNEKADRMILNVGLFTSGKNQGELFEVARKDPSNSYHFVGNQAENFRDYWEPLMKTKPENCIVWGERDDVDLFYQAADEFYFTSKWELFPLVIREALSYGLSVKLHKLDTYSDTYDNNPLITFI
jgi:hypothetical protein